MHWCMCMAVIPLLRHGRRRGRAAASLTGNRRRRQVQRRLRERFGERETVARAARRILRAYIDWRVLMETNEKGLYRGNAKRAVDDTLLALWAVKAMLFAAGDNPRSAPALLRGPHLFPFDVALPSVRDVEACEALEITRHGLDQQVLLGLSKMGAVRD